MEITNRSKNEVEVRDGGRRLTLPLADHDGRRSIFELDLGDATMQVFQIHSDENPLGGHFHCEKSETFTILAGGGSVLLCRADPDTGALDGEIREVRLSAGGVVNVPPGLAHTFYLVRGSEMACRATRPYDPADMHPAPLLVRQVRDPGCN